MSTRDSGFFVDDSPAPEPQADLIHKLAPWHRVRLCAAFLALMVVYLTWLLES
jgi:hypothetical protein